MVARDSLMKKGLRRAAPRRLGGKCLVARDSLMKKGLRRGFGGRHLGQGGRERFPDEEGIKTRALRSLRQTLRRSREIP